MLSCLVGLTQTESDVELHVVIWCAKRRTQNQLCQPASIDRSQKASI